MPNVSGCQIVHNAPNMIKPLKSGHLLSVCVIIIMGMMIYTYIGVQSGDSLRSSRRYGALDETPVFGCACRHEFPSILSMERG